MNTMQNIVNTELVRFAVQRAITCPHCGDVLDIDNAVLVTETDRNANGVFCGGCWDRLRSKLTPEQLAQLDIIDTRPPRPVVAPVKGGKRGTIKLAFSDGAREVEATIYGALAIHRTTATRHNARYTITHIATGFVVADDLRHNPARQLAALLLPLNWNFTDPGRVPQATREQARDIIRPFRRIRYGRNVA